jgi:hypothetical protein
MRSILGSTASIDKKPKKIIKEEVVGSGSKRQKMDLSPMHPTIYTQTTKVIPSPAQPPLDQNL